MHWGKQVKFTGQHPELELNQRLTHTQRCSCVSALTGHGEVAVTVIGSCCWGQTSDSQLSVIIYHRSSCGLDASACVCVCALVCVCVHAFVIVKEQAYYWLFHCIEKEKRNVEEERVKGGSWTSTEYECKRKWRLMIIFDTRTEDGITGSHRPPVSCELLTDVWWPNDSWCGRAEA